MNASGVSPIIATVILISFVVALSAVFVNFYQPFQQARQQELEESGGAQVECTFAAIEFTKDDVAYNITGTSDSVNVTIDNKGPVPLYDFEITVWVSGVSYSYEPRNTTKKTKSSPLGAGARDVLAANVTNDLSGTVEAVRVVAKNCPITARKVNL